MSVAFLVHGTERSSIQSNAPTTAEIIAAMRLVQRGTFPREGGGTRTRTALNGGWVGPGPRITRSAPVGAFVTQVSWVWALDDGQQATSLLSTTEAQGNFSTHLAADVHFALNAGATHGTAGSGDDWSVEALPFNEAANGTMEWWRSGDAARDAVFIENFPELASRMVPVDNPIGPNNPLAQGAGGSNPAAITSTISTVAVAGAVVAAGVTVTVLAVEFGPMIASWLKRDRPSKAAGAKANGRGRSRRTRWLQLAY